MAFGLSKPRIPSFSEEIDVEAKVPPISMTPPPQAAAPTFRPSVLSAGQPTNGGDDKKSSTLSKILKGLAIAGGVGLAAKFGGVGALEGILGGGASGWMRRKKELQDEERKRTFKREDELRNQSHDVFMNLADLDLSESPELQAAMQQYGAGLATDKPLDTKGLTGLMSAFGQGASSGAIGRARSSYAAKSAAQLQTEKTKAEAGANRELATESLPGVQGIKFSPQDIQKFALENAMNTARGKQTGELQKTAFDREASLRREMDTSDFEQQQSMAQMQGNIQGTLQDRAQQAALTRAQAAQSWGGGGLNLNLEPFEGFSPFGTPFMSPKKVTPVDPSNSTPPQPASGASSDDKIGPDGVRYRKVPGGWAKVR